jgi:hypothetical protein
MLNECLKGLGGDRIYMNSPRNFFYQKLHRDILHLQRDVPSFQCKMILDLSTSTGEVNGPSLHLTLRSSTHTMLPFSDAAYQVSEKIALCGLLHTCTCHRERGLIGVLEFGRHHFCTSCTG